jgi:energy-converting hydrogenase Eha subunit H
MSTKDKSKNETANGTKPVLGAVLAKIKKWNWTLFLVIICTAEMGAMGNKNIESISSAFLFGLVAGTILGLPLAILTKDVE